MNAGSFGDYRIRLTAQFSLSPAPLLYFCFLGFLRGSENKSPAFAGFRLGCGAVCREFEIVQNSVLAGGRAESACIARFLGKIERFGQGA